MPLPLFTTEKRNMKTETYKTIAGEELEYPTPTPDVAAFLSRVMAAAHDPTVSEPALTELIYGKENPVLDQTIFPGRGAVTKAVMANPVYHVMHDLLGAKRLQVGTLSPNAFDAFTLTVSEAAKELDVTPGAVRQAIERKLLPAIKRGPTYFLDHRGVKSYRETHTKRGRPAAPAVRVRYGSKPGASFRVKFAELKHISQDGHVIDAEAPRFERAAVAFSGNGKNRCFILEASKTSERFERDGFFIEGRFKVVEQVNDPAKAAHVFKTFKPT